MDPAETGRGSGGVPREQEPDLRLSQEDWELLRQGLARVFYHENSARTLLSQVGFPLSRLPSFTGGSPDQFWMDVIYDLESGIIDQPARRILQAALRVYPSNPIFRELELRYELDDSGRPAAADSIGPVFISYAREDAHAAGRLKQWLEAAGIQVWSDTSELRPGQDWRAEIRQAIMADTFVFIACFSHNSVSRKASYQNEELTIAIDELRVKRPDPLWLIPVRFDSCEIPDIELGAGRTLASIQRVDLFGDGFDEAVARLVSTVLRIIGGGRGIQTKNPATARLISPPTVDLESSSPTGDVQERMPGNMSALVVSADNDAGFAQDLIDSLKGLRAEFPLFPIDLRVVWRAPDIPDSVVDPQVSEADVVLIVVSRDLLATEYGLTPEVRLLLNRHDERLAIVFPVIFRAASWENQPFGRLAALPSGGAPVTGWPSLDEALKNIIDSLRIAIGEFRKNQAKENLPRSIEMPRVPMTDTRRTLELGEVFKPSGVPGLTFVEPDDFIEFRMALRQPGLGIVLEGSSGIGKTTILRHAVEQDAHRLGQVRILSARRPKDVEQIAKLPDGHAGLVAVDDFHRLPRTLQDKLADYLKRLADDDAVAAKLVVVGIPGTAQGLVAMGADLATRIRVFRLGRAADHLILQMIEKGEAALNISFDGKAEIVMVSVGSLLTAQMLCWHLVMMAGIEQTAQTTTTIRTDTARARARVRDWLRLKYEPMVDQFTVLDGATESLCIDLLLRLAKTTDGVLRLEEIREAQPSLRDSIDRIFIHGMSDGLIGRHARIAEHLYYDPRGVRLIADDPQFIFYLRQLNRNELLERAGKHLPIPRDQVFVCYSHNDVSWLNRLQVHLKPLDREGVIDLWSDRRLELGDQWRKEIDTALARARAALLLVSADFLASDFINEVELPQLLSAAEQGGCRIIPILVRPSLFMETLALSRFQHANPGDKTLSEMNPEESERALADLARSLMRFSGLIDRTER